MNIIIEASFILAKGRKYAVSWMLIYIRTYTFIFTANTAIDHARAGSLLGRRLAQTPIIHQSSIVLRVLILTRLVLTHVVLHVSLDYRVLESLCIYL